MSKPGKKIAEEMWWAILPKKGRVRTIDGCDLKRTREAARSVRSFYADESAYTIKRVVVTVREEP